MATNRHWKDWVQSCVIAASCVAMALVAAATVSAQTPAPPPTSPATGQVVWTGGFVGLSIGGNSAAADMTTTVSFDPAGLLASTSPAAIAAAGDARVRTGGITFGGHAGFDLQRGVIVYGLETEWGVMHVNAESNTTAVEPCCAPATFTIVQRTETNWLFTLRPRVGIAAGGVFLLYGTGGWARTHADYRANLSETSVGATESGRSDRPRNGWVIGAGIEVRPMNRWSLGAEYLHTDFGTASVQSTNLTAFQPPQMFPGNVFTHTSELSTDIVRATLRLRF